ncbi:MAG: tRNA pseudouridine(38-40) synthase TruA [Bryobacterales bacterium]|nr:tRNA pseudouridine(38-40) synthase TruA [Bryobacterales bacterium]
MRRIRLELSYDGTAYYGWQVQPGLATIQGELERVLARIEEAPVKVHGSGRTDAGVHAYAQVAAFDLENPIPVENLQRAMNRLLPKDIRVNSAAEAELDFHPRHHARAKTYRYRIFREPICPPFERFFYWHQYGQLDELAMSKCAPSFVGLHNFRAFAAADDRYTAETDMHRTVFSVELLRKDALLQIDVRGSGFLKHMVRNLVGALMEVGTGNLSEQAIAEMLESGRRTAGIRTAPASGLFLLNVEY